MRSGVVRWFSAKKGYGFIDEIDVSTGKETGESFFVHYRSLVLTKVKYGKLHTGEYVQYDVTSDAKGQPVATSVSGAWGGLLMCDRPLDA